MSYQRNIIVDFTKIKSIKDWVIVDDDVMGGMSNGYLRINEDGYGEFHGNVSLENYGGFTSMQNSLLDIEVKDLSFLTIKVKGDNSNYQIRIKSELREEFWYIYEFNASDKWSQINIPLKEMKPSYRGKFLSLQNFNHKYISEIAILIGNKKNQNFNLEIESISLS